MINPEWRANLIKDLQSDSTEPILLEPELIKEAKRLAAIHGGGERIRALKGPKYKYGEVSEVHRYGA